MTSVTSDMRLTDFSVRLWVWLTFECDPSCGCLDRVTLSDLARIFVTSRQRVRSALAEIRRHGYVDYEFPGHGRPGWIVVTHYYGDVFYPNERLARRWAQGAPKRSRIRRSDGRPPLEVVRD